MPTAPDALFKTLADPTRRAIFERLTRDGESAYPGRQGVTSITRFINPLIVNNMIDANIVNDVASGQDGAVNEIVRLNQAGEVLILLPHTVQTELKNSSTPTAVREAGNRFIFSMQVPLTEPELRQYRELIMAVKGNSLEKNVGPDLAHVSEAAKYGGYFITKDKWLLGRRDGIAQRLQLEVVSPPTFLERVEQARERNKRFGRPEAIH